MDKDEIINQIPLITKSKHPYTGQETIVSQELEKLHNSSLCYNCEHKTNNFKDCEVASLLYEIAKTTGVSTLVRWCPLFKHKNLNNL